MQKIIQIISTVLSYIGAIPAWLLPDKFKGYRTQLYLILGGLFGILESLKVSNVIPTLCSFLSSIGVNCSVEGITSIIIAIMAGIGTNLREKTNTEIYKQK